ncbi:MAG: hypothetical protein LBF02_01570 [Mycoplasmataceae bacterium]|jgi:phosphotransferase system IIB component|nr:hypothetical protein [Mycoplasmataceae bacterium]
MSSKNKTLLLSILSFGIYALIIKRKALKELKKREKQNTSLIYSNKIDFNLNNMITKLGGYSNIEKLILNYTSIKLFFKEKPMWDNSYNSTFKIKGAFFSSDSVTLLFGDNAKTIYEEIIKEMNKNLSN